ncbi:MAG: GumC family protein [Rubrivivax sp.]
MKPGVEWATAPQVPLPAVADPRSTPLRDILTQAFRDRWRIALTFVLGMLLTGIAATLPSKKYTAEAALLLRLGREYIYTPEVGEGGGSPVAYDREQLQVAEARILASREVKERVLQKLGVASIYPHLADESEVKQREGAILAFERALQAELVRGSNLLQVSFTHKDPQMAAQVLHALIDAYLAKRSVIFSSATAGTAEADFTARKQQLDSIETRIAQLKEQRRIRAFGEEQSLLLAQRNAIELKLAEAAVSLSQSSSRSASLREGLAGTLGEVTLSSETQRSDAAESARRTLLDLKLRERDLTSKFSETNPTVMDVRSDIRRTEEFLRELERNPVKTLKTGRNPTRDVAESELMRSQAVQRQATAATTNLQRQRTDLDRRLSVLADSERELLGLERERRIAEQSYEAAARRLRNETAMEELDRKRRSNVSIVQPPVAPLQGSSIAPVILAIGTVLSLCLASLVAFLSALWRDSFLSPEQVERELGIPVLAAIPERTP